MFVFNNLLTSYRQTRGAHDISDIKGALVLVSQTHDVLIAEAEYTKDRFESLVSEAEHCRSHYTETHDLLERIREITLELLGTAGKSKRIYVSLPKYCTDNASGSRMMAPPTLSIEQRGRALL